MRKKWKINLKNSKLFTKKSYARIKRCSWDEKVKRQDNEKTDSARCRLNSMESVTWLI